MARILFLQDSGINESLAVTELSAWLKREGHHTHLLLEEEEPQLDAEIRRYDPDVAIIPCHIAGHTTAFRLAEATKRASSAVTVLGGTHATFDPDIVKRPEVDFGVRGEAEAPLTQLLEALGGSGGYEDIAGLVYEGPSGVVANPLAPLLHDLDQLPMPDRALYFRYPFMGRFGWKKFTSGRGCIHTCAFCWNPHLKDMVGGRVPFTRRKSAQRTVDEIAAVAARWPLNNVHFSDDLFTHQPRWLEQFADLYPSQVGIPFTANSSVELVSERTASALARAGCRGVAIGIETGNEKLREKILNKRVRNDDVRRAARLIKGHGMELTTFNMLASPGETLEDAWETVRLNQEIGTDHMRVALAVPIPFTSWETDEPLDARLDDLGRPYVSFDSNDEQAFENLYYLLRIAVHWPWAEPLVRKLATKLPSSRPLDPLRLLIPWEEGKIGHIGLVDGLRFFRHVGDPKKRTANYVTLI